MKCFLTLLSSCICSLVYAQSLTYEHNGIRIGDVLIQKRVVSDNLWNLCEAEFTDDDYADQYIGQNTDTITRIFQNTQYHYRQSNDTLLFLGYENNMIRIHNAVPEIVMRFPLLKDESLYGVLNSFGMYCDRVFLKKEGEYHTKVAGEGTLFLSENDSIEHVLLVTTDRNFTVSTQEDTLHAFNLMHINEHYDRMYAPGYRYPIIERQILRKAGDGGQILSQDMFFCSPEIQSQSNFDEANSKLRQNTDRAQGQRASGNRWTDATEYISDFLSYDNENKSISFTYMSDKATSGMLILADVSGRVYKTVNFNGGASETTSVSLSYAAFGFRQYILYVKINGQTYKCSFYASKP